jgi:lysophospholipase L1-like esterase
VTSHKDQIENDEYNNDDGGGSGTNGSERGIDDAYLPTIRGDYSTVMSTQDVTTLSANVPVPCSNKNHRNCYCTAIISPTTTSQQLVHSTKTTSSHATSHSSDSNSESRSTDSTSRSKYSSVDSNDEGDAGWKKKKKKSTIVGRTFRGKKQHQDMEESSSSSSSSLSLSTSSTLTSSLSTTTTTSFNSRIIPVPGTFQNWQTAHQDNEEMALSKDATRANVVFYGDSITERWHGTLLGGVGTTKDIQATAVIFDKLFRLGGGGDDDDEKESTIVPSSYHGKGLDGRPRSGTTSNLSMSSEVTSITTTRTPIANKDSILLGLPLGIAGDTTPNLLWRLQNGELPLNLNPQIFVVLIGTNDLGKDMCSPENTVVGIVRVVEEILKQRPTSTVLLHGLLPRTNNKAGYLYPRVGSAATTGSGSALVGRTTTKEPSIWENIVTINDEIQRYARHREGVLYVDTNVFFTDLPTKEKIDMDLMPDGLHPSPRGYELWGTELQGKIFELLHKT